jgi:ribosomal protein S18 acetylase RimI-like enzyme
MDVSQGEVQPSKNVGLSSVDPIPFTSGVLLTEEHLSVIADFTCAAPGMPETRFERDVSEWLKDTRAGAFMAVRLGLSEVRLFFCAQTGALIGYGAIGVEPWRFPDSSYVALWVLQYAGVHTNFRHLPNVSSNSRFGRRLITGMLKETEARGGCGQVGLFVDPENPAKNRYRDELLFRLLDEEQDGDRRWMRMVRPLTVESQSG